MNSASNTNFLNSKNRRIYQGKSGGFFIMKQDGTKKYKPTAAFRQVGNGSKTKVTAANANVPNAIRRKTRKNAGVTRVDPAARKPAAKKAGPAKRPGRKPTTVRGMMKAGLTPNAGDMTRMLLSNYNKPKKAAPKPRAAPKSRMMKSPKATRPVLNLIVVSPGGTSKVQKVRKPRSAVGAMKKGMVPNAGDLTRMLLDNYDKPKKTRKIRKNKGVKRGPRGIKGMRVNKNPFQALS